MSDFRFRGFEVTDEWPTASRIKGATKPSTERYLTFSGEKRIWAFTQREMRACINQLLQAEVG